MNNGRRGLNFLARRQHDLHHHAVDVEASPPAVGTIATAVCRAIESRRADAWFSDPLAEYVAEIAELRRADEPPADMICWVAVRTRFIDDLLAEAVRDGLRQVVLLGAELDARAFRLPWPDGVQLFEVDRAPVLGAKQRLLDDLGAEPGCDRHVVVADLTAPTWPQRLIERGFRAERSTCWVAEDASNPLAAGDQAAQLAGLTAHSRPGSRLGLTCSGVHPTTDVVGSVSDEAGARLRRIGWDADVITLADAADNYDRPLDWPSSKAESALLIDATRSDVRGVNVRQ